MMSLNFPFPRVALTFFVMMASQRSRSHCHYIAEEPEDMVTTLDVDAVVGKTATLPCDIEPESNEDRVYMVLWFRNSGKPIYSFDVRGRSFIKALHWSDPLALGSRAYFVTISRPAALTIDQVQLDDQGTFRCRVDFKNSPTRNVQIRLHVIVPPHQMLLYDEKGRDIAGKIGPLEEGGNFVLLCELRGGQPQPAVKWLMNDTIIDHSIVDNDGRVLISKIQLRGAQRDWLNSTVRCQATNTYLLSPHERSARIEMHLRPVMVNVTNKPDQVDANIRVTLICVTQGSRPPAQIAWYRENRRYTRGKVEEFMNETTTVSHLTLLPQPEDDGATIRCRAENPILSTGIEDVFRMVVVYKPVVSLSLGSTLNPNEIKEGDDAYFECNVKANPKEHRISWYRDNGTTVIELKTTIRQDKLITQNLSSGIFISTKSLVLQKVTREEIGLYSCKAINYIGETTSPPVYLRVQFAPVCTQTTPVLIGARLDEQLRIRCVVKADPAEVSFYWQFNNSGESFQVSPARYVSSGGTASELRYSAASERDYGALLCSSSNSVGKQEEACVFQVIPATRPSPPRNCTAIKIPRHSEPLLAVRCLVGYDGGMRTHYTLETTGEPSELLVNTTNGYGYNDGRPPNLVVWLNVSWSMLEDMREEQDLKVTAHNAKGPSEPVIINEFFRDPVKKIESTEVRESTKVPIAVALVALAALLAAAGALAAVILKKRPETTTTVTSKRPSQSVVQVDSQGRRYLFAYPATSDKETKPDILNPKPDTAHPPRVVLESSGNTYSLREMRPGNSTQPPPPDEKVPVRTMQKQHKCTMKSDTNFEIDSGEIA